MARRPKVYKEMAFGVEPSTRRYRLRLARYVGAAETLAAHADARGASPDRPMELLDVGCRKGRLLRYLEAALDPKRLRLTGIDVDVGVFERLYKPEAWRLAYADAARSLPFRSGAFDAVVCEQVVEHMADPGPLMDEIARVLRPGGLLILGLPIYPPSLAWVRETIVPLWDRLLGIERGHERAYLREDALELVRRTGAFDVTDARGFRVHFFGSGGPIALLEDHRWYWRVASRLARTFPTWAVEVQIAARRR